MLNKERVKLMVKLASYESKQGKEDLKISSYYKKDYVSINRWFTVLWTTIGYILLVGMFGFAYMDELMEKMSSAGIAVAAGVLVGGYFALVIVYCVIVSKFYEEKHVQARRRVKKYSHSLLILDKVYKKEKR